MKFNFKFLLTFLGSCNVQKCVLKIKHLHMPKCVKLWKQKVYIHFVMCLAVSVEFYLFLNRSPGRTVTENDANAIMMCSGKSEPANYIVSWIQYAPDGIIPIKEYSPTRIHDGIAYLAFASSSYMDSGVYHCFAENGIEDYKTGNLKDTNNTVLVVKGKSTAAIQIAQLYFLNFPAETETRMYHYLKNFKLQCASEYDKKKCYPIMHDVLNLKCELSADRTSAVEINSKLTSNQQPNRVEIYRLLVLNIYEL